MELKDKIAVTGIESAATVKSVAVAANTEIYEEAVAALTMLGFAQAPSQKVTAQILKEEPDAPVEKVIKLALKRTVVLSLQYWSTPTEVLKYCLGSTERWGWSSRERAPHPQRVFLLF